MTPTTNTPPENPMSVHFSSATDMWSTPQAFFDVLNAKHRFTLDVCATADNAKCLKYFTLETDGLKQDWTGSVWMNPPYGREIVKWMKKAYESSMQGATVVCLVPARTDTHWWHEYAAKGAVNFIKGRLKFGNAVNSAPFPSAVVIFYPAPAVSGEQTGEQNGINTAATAQVSALLFKRQAMARGVCD